MPWSEHSLMNERMIFIAACLERQRSFGAICLHHGISRKTGYKWLKRYHAEGTVGLADLSSARHTQSHAVDPALADRLLALRRARPTWGPRKLLARLALDDAALGSAGSAIATDWPAASTVGDLLARHDLTRQRVRRQARAGAKVALTPPAAPNESWAIDFKGWFRTLDGVRCEPLTLSDGFSRFLMACQALPQTNAAYVQPVLIEAFRTHGMPRSLRSDNGSPFASRSGIGGLTRLSVWLLRLDIWPDRIDPGRPDQNGRHERMHRVLNEDVALRPAATLMDQQRLLDAWRADYNGYRPHEALGQLCPATLYTRSARSYPETIADWDYPADHQVRRVNGKGYVTWRDTAIYLTEALHGQTIALAQTDDDHWAVRFRQFTLATLSDATNKIRPAQLARTRPAETSPQSHPS